MCNASAIASVARRARVLLPLAAALVVACGDDPDDASNLVGLYQVTAWTAVDGDCAGTPTPVTGSTHLFVKTAKFFTVQTLEVEACAAAEGCGADPQAGAEFTFFEHAGGTWLSQITSASYFDGSCGLGYSETTLTATKAGAIHIQQTFSTGDLALAEAACTPDAAKAHLGELTCDHRAVVDATPL